MKRRALVFGFGSATVVWPFAARAQARRSVPTIGLLEASERLEYVAAFRRQLRELGYEEGQNIRIAARFARGMPDQLPNLARELVKMNVAVIVAGGTAAALEARRATTTIPIVTATGADHVSMGLAVTLARPGRNVTGLTSISSELTGKRLGVLREVFPRLSKLGVLWHVDNIGSVITMRDLEAAATASKVTLQNLGVTEPKEFAGAFAAAVENHAEAMFVIHSPFFFPQRQQIGELALKHRLVTMNGPAEYADAGGLVAFAPSYPDLYRRAAIYVDRILKGAKPANLPIEQPTKYEIVVNLKTAKALGITVPQSVLVRADRVIE